MPIPRDIPIHKEIWPLEPNEVRTVIANPEARQCHRCPKDLGRAYIVFATQEYLCEECAEAWRRERRNARLRREREEKPCPVCERPYSRKRGAMYCSTACKQKAYRRR